MYENVELIEGENDEVNTLRKTINRLCYLLVFFLIIITCLIIALVICYI